MRRRWIMAVTLIASYLMPSGRLLGQALPGRVPTVFAPGVVSTGRFEYGLVMHPDGQQVFYNVFDKASSSSTVFSARRTIEGWAKPEALIQGSGSCEISAISADGERMLFSSNRLSEFGSGPMLRHADIWESQTASGDRSKLRNLGAPINSRERDLHPSLGASGTLFFHRSYADFSTAILVAPRHDGYFEEPVPLGPEINGSKDAHNPCISPDESILVFTSYREGGFGNADLYVSFRGANGSWSEARNLGAEINSPFQDDFASISPDGSLFFFASDRATEGSCDIYWADAGIVRGGGRRASPRGDPKGDDDDPDPKK